MRKHDIITTKAIEIIPKLHKDKKQGTIPLTVKAEAIIQLAQGISPEKVAKALGIAKNTAIKLKKDNHDLILKIQTDLLKEKLQKDSIIINKYLNLLDKKADRLDDNEKMLDNTKATELAGVVKDIFNKQQLEQGKATSITEYKGKSEQDLLYELKEATLLLEQGDKKALLTAVFKDQA